MLKAVTRKLKPRLVGPFQAEVQVGASAFKVTLPATMQVCPVLNISLLRPYQGNYKPPGPIEVEWEAEYKSRRLYNTEVMVEDDNTLYAVLFMMPVKIVG